MSGAPALAVVLVLSMARARRTDALVVLAALAVLTAGDDTLAVLETLLPAPLLAGAEDLVRAASRACDMLPLEGVFTGSLPPLRVLVAEADGAQREAALAAAPAHGPLVLYVPGWGNAPDDEAAQALVPSLLRHAPRVLVLDTRPAFRRGYVGAAARVPAAARQLARYIRRHATPADLHLVGFSLGAHVAGRAARLARRGGSAAVGRLTALDPARPCFGAAAARGLRRDDAAFVQVVHSSAGVLGVARALGHADVYVGPQPACARRRLPLECDHNQAWRLYAESARDAAALHARRCRGRAELAAGACSGDAEALGYFCSNRSTGMFLYTAPSS